MSELSEQDKSTINELDTVQMSLMYVLMQPIE